MSSSIFIKYLVSVVVFTLPIVAVCTNSETKDMPITSLHNIALEDAELSRLKMDALDGSSDAADKIARHYLIGQGNPGEALSWALIAAENGSVSGQYLVGFLLKDKDDEQSQRRAIFWLRKAASQGSSVAQSLLEELKD